MKDTIYISLQNDSTPSFHLARLPENAVKISTETHQKLLNGLNMEQKLVYEDKNIIPDGTGNQFKLRDVNTIWDEKAKKYVVDTTAIEAQAKQVLIGEANQAYRVSILDRHQYNKLESKQQKELDSYLDALLEITKGDSEAKELPVKPEFLG